MSNTDDEKRAARIEVVMLPRKSIQPNGWNPNRMEKDEFAQFVEAVRTARALTKPLVVCPAAGGGHVLVDGEHALRAAEQAGLAEVPCQVLELGEFEMMRETHVRNIHGRPHPVLRGRLFERMTALKEMSNRQLGTLLGVSEGTVRNALLYAQAAEVRHRHAAALGRSPEETDDEIGALTVQDIRDYLAMPDEARDAWLDRGRPAGASVPGRPPPAQPGSGGECGGARGPRSQPCGAKAARARGGRHSGPTSTPGTGEAVRRADVDGLPADGRHDPPPAAMPSPRSDGTPRRHAKAGGTYAGVLVLSDLTAGLPDLEGLAERLEAVAAVAREMAGAGVGLSAGQGDPHAVVVATDDPDTAGRFGLERQLDGHPPVVVQPIARGRASGADGPHQQENRT